MGSTAPSDYYELLGVEKGDPTEKIRKGYLKQARLYHPDKTSDPTAEERFKKISAAYQVDVSAARTYAHIHICTHTKTRRLLLLITAATGAL